MDKHFLSKNIPWKRLTQSELNVIIDKHHAYLIGKTGGRRACLSFCDVSGLDFHESDLTNCDISLIMAKSAKMNKCKFISANLMAGDFSNSSMKSCDFTNADMRGVCLSNTNMMYCNFSHTDLRDASVVLQDKNYDLAPIFVNSKLSNTNLQGSTISKTKMSSAFAIQANMTNCNITDSIFSHANLTMCDFSGSTIKGTIFLNSIADQTNFNSSILDKCDFNGTNMNTSSLAGVLINETRFEDPSIILKTHINDITLIDMISTHEKWIKSGGKDGGKLEAKRINIIDKNLSKTTLSAVDFYDCLFENVQFNESNMILIMSTFNCFSNSNMNNLLCQGSNFSGSIFTNTSMKKINASPLYVGGNVSSNINSQYEKVRFINCDLSESIFEGANLKNCIFENCQINDTDFSNADLSGSSFIKTKFENAKLENSLIDNIRII